MTNDAAPVSWITLEKGTTVLSCDGEKVGAVGDVVGDRQKDIFSGITITAGLFGSDRFAPADLIAAMDADGVRLSIDSQRTEELDVYDG